MKGTDGTPLMFIERVAADEYTTFGMHLLQDGNGNKVEVIKKDHSQDAKSITQAIIREWLTSGGPRTYQHLIECLKKSGLGALAEDIAKCCVQQ